MKIGFVGLGNMGHAIAQCLIAAGHELTVWNRTPAKANDIKARRAETIAHAANNPVVFSVLFDDQATSEVVYGEQGLLKTMPQGAIHVGGATIGKALADQLARDHKAAGQTYVGAPVFGRPDAATAKKLILVAGGEAEALNTVRPLLETYTARVFEVKDAGQAHLFKLIGNFLMQSAVEAMSEGFALLDKAGADTSAFYTMITETLFSAPIYKNYGKMILDEDYGESGGFSLAGVFKDTSMALEAAVQVQAPLPFASLIRDQTLSAVAKGQGNLDAAAFGRLARDRAGLS
jgi:3-hydroxyisobutyrate dehydrogenase-like beta-hydroxyacid dehydrogenase